MTVETAGKIKKSHLTRRKSWISLLNSAEICKKKAVTQVNFHLKRIETPKPDKDGKIGLHKPGDGTVTYGYGEVLKGKTEITDELKAKYPPMTEEEATRHLIEDVLPDYEKLVSNRLFNRNMTATQQEFDAYVLDEYNTDSGPLMNKIKNSNDKSKAAITKIFKEHKITYPGLPKRREAEAKVYTEGDYSEDFTW